MVSLKLENKNIFLSLNTSSGVFSSDSSLIIIVFESIGFIVVGVVMLYLSSFQSDVLFYVFVGLAVTCLAIGLHILFALILHLARSRHR
ncbi:MAG: hypothetical protein QW320_08715 [Ignisphaera sp.]